MNLLSSSNSNSIEIGCKLETIDELDELKKFVKNFINTNESEEIPNQDDLYLSKEKFIVVLENYIANYTKSRTQIFYKNGHFNINSVNNNFFLYINKVQNCISIAGILSGKEAENFEVLGKSYFKSDYFNYELLKGGNGYYDMIGATSRLRLSNSYLDNLRVNEKKILIAEISELIKNVKEFKDAC